MVSFCDGYPTLSNTKNHCTVHFKWIIYTVSELYLNKVAIKKKRGRPGQISLGAMLTLVCAFKEATLKFQTLKQHS